MFQNKGTFQLPELVYFENHTEKYAEHNSFHGRMEKASLVLDYFILFYPGRVNLISLHKGENSLGKIWYNAPLGEITEVQMLKS